ncbi:MAG: sialate O-acetylesterase, partial [Gemmatimonadota bacterium]
MSPRPLRVILAALAAVALGHGGAAADVRLPAIFGDHMVLQQQQPIRVWGWAEPGEQVTVHLGRHRARATADAGGRWQVELPARKAGGPTRLVVEGANRLELTDVLVGEVWIGSGQSNMQMSVQAVDDAGLEIEAADHPRIRLFTVPRVPAFSPQEDVVGTWQVCSPETVPGFSAVAYFFGRQIHRELGVPVGLVNSSWGGTIIEAWMDRGALEGAGLEAERLGAIDEARSRLPDLERQKAAIRAAMLQALGDDGPASPALDDAGWRQMETPTTWEQGGLPGYDGLVWFRKQVEVPAGWAGHDLVLHLGPVDEIDDTFFNGVRVGGLGSFEPRVTDYWDDPRVYTIPGKLVAAGANLLAVRCIDGAGAGGLWGAEAKDMVLVPADAAPDEVHPVSVAGPWRYRAGPQLVTVPELGNPNQPTVLYNAMIHPLIPLSLRGALWYQGESNRGQGLEYELRMRALIGGWRGLWGLGDFPFLYVQLAPFRYGSDPELLGAIWEAQRRVLAVPNTGMAVTTDIGNLADIHPTNKQEVGRRLALWALARTYGRQDLVYSGPLVAGAAAEGSSL